VSGCRDEYKKAGETGKLGYPVEYTMTMYENPTAAPTILKMETKSLSTAPLDPSLFEAPAGFTESGAVTTAGADTNPPAVDATGRARIGIAPLLNKSGATVQVNVLEGQIAAQFANTRYRTAPLSGSSDAELLADARAKQCDYVLVGEVTEVKRPAIGKVGGLLGRATGNHSGPVVQARVDYRLISTQRGDALLASAASGSTGSVMNLRTAVSVATMASTFGMSRYAMNPMMAQSMLSPQGFGMDPAMRGFSLMQTQRTQTANPMMPGGPSTPEEAAVISAFEHMAKAVAQKLGETR
jgi:hypothetical protein